MPPERVTQLVQASNLIYWEALWSAAKNTTEIAVLRRHASPIDIVSESGLKWTKVSTINERRLLMEMAKQGWDWVGSDEEDDEDFPKPADDDIDISIVKMAVQLRDMANEKRIRYRRPKILFVFTRVTPGNKEIDKILDHIRATGASLQTADQLTEPPPIEDVLEDMVMDEFKRFSPTLNIDCTLLLAIVSDISHGQVNEEPWFNNNVRRQIDIEKNEQLMTRSLWPAMLGHDLVCTKHAAQRMREIVEMIATPTERARTSLMMGDVEGQTSAQLLEGFQELSEHTIPNNWRLPVKVVDEYSLESSALPPFALSAVSELTDINRSVFLSGWASGSTTITSNRVTAKIVEKGVEQHRHSDDDLGPDIWICPIARSLVAKEKDRPENQNGGEV